MFPWLGDPLKGYMKNIWCSVARPPLPPHMVMVSPPPLYSCGGGGGGGAGGAGGAGGGELLVGA